MNAALRRHEPVLLWPQGAPGARGQTPEDCPRLTPYLCRGRRPHACIVVCPGGGYTGRAPHEAAPIAEWLNRCGVSACVLDYRVAPYRHPTPLEDARRALRLVRAQAAEWDLDPGRVGILGFSAGGHVAASAATIFDRGQPGAAEPVERESSRPDALILCYPVISFEKHVHRGCMENLLGPDPDWELRVFLSLENRVTPETPPTFLWHTSTDGAVAVENSLVFAQSLRRHGVRFALHVFPDGPHGLGLARENPTVSAWTGLCAEWLTELGFAPRHGNHR